MTSQNLDTLNTMKNEECMNTEFLSRTMMASQSLNTLNTMKNKKCMNTGRVQWSRPASVLSSKPYLKCTRWNPTREQLRILEDIYRRYTRTPNAQEIQQITALLAFYGKIEGKNVFYWFQNHKARDRQKLKCTTETKHEPSNIIFAVDSALVLSSSLIIRHERKDECLEVLEWSSVEKYRTRRPLETLELFPTCSGF